MNQITETQIKRLAVALGAAYWRGRLETTHRGIDEQRAFEAMIAGAAETGWEGWKTAATTLLVGTGQSDSECEPTNRQRLGDGVTAQMQGDELCLSAQNGDGSEDVIIMNKCTCDNLMLYIHQHVLCK